MILVLLGVVIGLALGLEIGARRVRQVASEIHIHSAVDANAVRRELAKRAKRGSGYGFQ